MLAVDLLEKGESANVVSFDEYPSKPKPTVLAVEGGALNSRTGKNCSICYGCQSRVFLGCSPAVSGINLKRERVK